MNEEERKKLCADLRRKHYGNSRLRHEAANEIERLANRVAELEALPPDNARWAIHDNHWTFR